MRIIITTIITIFCDYEHVPVPVPVASSVVVVVVVLAHTGPFFYSQALVGCLGWKTVAWTNCLGSQAVLLNGPKNFNGCKDCLCF